MKQNTIPLRDISTHSKCHGVNIPHFPSVMVLIIKPCLCLCFHWSSFFNKSFSSISNNKCCWYFSKLFGKHLLTNFCEGKGKYNGNSWYKKFIHVVKVLGIRDTDTSNLSLKSGKTILTMRAFFNVQVYWYFHFGILISHLCICLCLTKNEPAFGSKHLNTAIIAS